MFYDSQKSNVDFEKEQGKIACFVNSESPPDSVVWQNHYDYFIDLDDKMVFIRLCKEKYIFQSQIAYTQLRWHVVPIKLECIDSMKAMIDLQKGAEKFIQTFVN